MTVKETLAAIADATDTGEPKLAIFQPVITKATRRKNGDTVLTLNVVTNEFTVEDVMRGVTGWLALGTIERLKSLMGSDR